MTAMTRGKLAARANCHPETIRYYEQVGLLPSPPRSPGGHRLYEETHWRRLVFIQRSRRLGFSIEEVTGLLRLVDRQEVTCSEVRSTTLLHLASVRQRIRDLRRMERALASTAALCAGGNVPDCPILETLWRGEG